MILRQRPTPFGPEMPAKRRMIVMPANSTGWLWHCLGRETGRIGHLVSPGSERGPWPWFPIALDNGAFSCWDMADNYFDPFKWEAMKPKWHALLFWAQVCGEPIRWAIVPDVPGNALATMERWQEYAPFVQAANIPLAVAVQDGMTPDGVRQLRPLPEVVAVGGTTDWKWETAEQWCREFPRVHVLRCNSPAKLHWLESIGCESTDGTGWNRGDKRQTRGLEEWARKGLPPMPPLWPHACRAQRKGHKSEQLTFA